MIVSPLSGSITVVRLMVLVLRVQGLDQTPLPPSGACEAASGQGASEQPLQMVWDWPSPPTQSRDP